MHSSWKFTFRLLLLCCLGLFCVWLGLQGYVWWINSNIAKADEQLSQQQHTLEGYKSLSGFVELMAIKELEGKYTEMPWSDHIRKIITMLENVQSLGGQQSGTLLLSDFYVDLQKLSLKGRVSNLMLLYYSNPASGYVPLIDKFKNLDFVKDLHIKHYTREDGFFSFVLEATVVSDGK